MAQDNMPKSVKDRIKEWDNKTNTSDTPPKKIQNRLFLQNLLLRKSRHGTRNIKKQTDLTTHSQALDIFVDTPSPQVETQKPIIFSKPFPERTKVPEETPKKQSNLTVQEKIEKFFKIIILIPKMLLFWNLAAI
ncbi:hypothetical protein [Candidatus Rickettsia kedanie]|uniref:Uncharacterized protein n=1 Tax=Candidatus Rickettsia kedanie TaxID=3115352 RepID=A0ABP9TX40_9RICK